MTVEPPSPCERAYLDAYKDATAMPDAARDRVWARLAGGPAGPFGGEAANDPGVILRGEAAGRGAWLARPGLVLGAAVAVVTTAAVLWLQAGDRPSDPPAAVVAAAPEQRAPAVVLEEPGEPELGEPARPSVATEPIVVPAEPEAGAPPKPRKRSAVRTAAKPEPQAEPEIDAPPSSLAGERRLIEQVHAALGHEETELALTLLRRHAVEFEAGIFVEEREALQAIATCTAGRLDDGRTAARRFLASYPTAVLAARVRSTCALED